MERGAEIKAGSDRPGVLQANLQDEDPGSCLSEATSRAGAERPPGGAAEPAAERFHSPLTRRKGRGVSSGNVCIYSVAGVKTSYIERERQRETAAEIPPSL